MQAGDVVLHRDRPMPVLTGAILANADGILGVEGLASARIDIDFADDRVTIAHSNGRRRADAGFLTIPATLQNEGLLMVAARVGRVRTKAIIDTGAERTLGNAALRNALLLTPRRRSTSGRWNSGTWRSRSPTCTCSASGTSSASRRS